MGSCPSSLICRLRGFLCKAGLGDQLSLRVRCSDRFWKGYDQRWPTHLPIRSVRPLFGPTISKRVTRNACAAATGRSPPVQPARPVAVVWALACALLSRKRPPAPATPLQVWIPVLARSARVGALAVVTSQADGSCVGPREALDKRRLPAYTSSMSTDRHQLAATACLCNALRQASRAVSRLYDEELRSVGLRTTQLSLLHHLAQAGQVRQGDLVGLTHLEETTLTRNLRPLTAAGWVSICCGNDRRERIVAITEAGAAKLAEARPAWERAQTRMQALLPEGTWQGLLAILPEIARLTARA